MPTSRRADELLAQASTPETIAAQQGMRAIRAQHRVVQLSKQRLAATAGQGIGDQGCEIVEVDHHMTRYGGLEASYGCSVTTTRLEKSG